MEENTNLFVPIYNITNEAEFLVAKSILDNAGIVYNTRGENLNNVYGASTLVIEVTNDNLDEANELLKDFIIDPNIPKDENEKIQYEKKSEFSFVLAIGSILGIILLIFLTVVIVRC